MKAVIEYYVLRFYLFIIYCFMYKGLIGTCDSHMSMAKCQYQLLLIKCNVT